MKANMGLNAGDLPGVWEKLYNPDCNDGEFAIIENEGL